MKYANEKSSGRAKAFCHPLARCVLACPPLLGVFAPRKDIFVVTGTLLSARAFITTAVHRLGVASKVRAALSLGCKENTQCLRASCVFWRT